jgi:N-acetylneuraminic acid mutarotase
MTSLVQRWRSYSVLPNINSLPLDWEVLLPAGPALTNHAGCIIDNVFYIHGGVTKHRSIIPSNKLYKLDFSSMIWNEVRIPGSPALSHHACVTLNDRYMVLIGGWNGHGRTPKIFVFDTVDNQWIYPTDTGFPEGAGLSSHAAVVLETGDILVVGREGCLRTIEKHGNAYLLSGSVQKGAFNYTKISDDTDSRSGHTITTLDKSAYIIGGRDDDFIEFHNGFTSTEPIGHLNSNFINIFKQVPLKALNRFPNGRRNHVTVGGKGCLLIHGGETFDGKSRHPVGEMFLMTTKPEVQFYKLGTSQVARAGHVCVSTGDRIILHGGVGWKNVVYGDCYELKFKF